MLHTDTIMSLEELQLGLCATRSSHTSWLSTWTNTLASSSSATTNLKVAHCHIASYGVDAHTIVMLEICKFFNNIIFSVFETYRAPFIAEKCTKTLSH